MVDSSSTIAPTPIEIGICVPRGRDNSSPDPTDGSTVSLADYESALAEARKRQSGTEKAYRKQVEELTSKIESLEARVTTAAPSTAVDLPDLPDDEYGRHIKNLYGSMRAWQESLLSREQVAERGRRLQEARAEAQTAGVPDDELDDTSPDSIRISTERYLDRKERDEMRKEMAALRTDLAKSTTVARAESGAHAVSTATGPGQPPPSPLTAHEQLRLVREEKADFDRRNDGGASVMAARATRRLQAWIDQTGGNQPMPANWRPGVPA